MQKSLKIKKSKEKNRKFLHSWCMCLDNRDYTNNTTKTTTNYNNDNDAFAHQTSSAAKNVPNMSLPISFHFCARSDTSHFLGVVLTAWKIHSAMTEAFTSVYTILIKYSLTLDTTDDRIMLQALATLQVAWGQGKEKKFCLVISVKSFGRNRLTPRFKTPVFFRALFSN